MLDEAYFQLFGHVNKHNIYYWSVSNNQDLNFKPLQSSQVTIWCGVLVAYNPHFPP